MKIIKTLLEERKKYPVGSKKENKNQVDYILDKIGDTSEITYLILPSLFLERNIKAIAEVKELIFENYHLSALIGLGKIWEPYTALDFILIVLDRIKQKEIFICEAPDCKTFKSTKPIPNSDSIKNQIIMPAYNDFLKKVDNYLVSANEDGLDGFRLKQTGFNIKKFHPKYYAPQFLEIEKKLSKEKTEILSNLVDIIISKNTKNEGKVLKVKNFEYPLNIRKLSKGRRGDEALRKGDLLISRVGNSKSYLVSQDLEKIYPSSHTYILRIKSNKITPEYLFLFLQSEVAKKYVLRNSKGIIMRRLNKATLDNLTIIIPNKETLSKSKQVFETLFLKTKEDRKISEINDLLFSKKKNQKPIQEEFVNELLEKIKFTKLDLIKEIIEADFVEIQKCVKYRALKASLVLCGSILEAVLIDWLSEIKNRNYINSRDELNTFEMIREIEKAKIFDRKLSKYAHEVRNYRNLIHPKKMLKKEIDLNEQMVKDAIWKLKKILEKRELG